MRRKHIAGSIVVAAAVGGGCPDAGAVEGTLSVYSLGSGAVAAGTTPPEGAYFSFGTTYYRWRVAKPIPFAGTTISADIYMPVGVGTMLWVTPAIFLGGQLSFSVTSGFADMKIIGGTTQSQQSARGTGAIDTSFRMSLGWKVNEAFSHKVSITQVAPTGRYAAGFNPDIGLNRPGTDLSWGASFTEPGSKIELSGTAGFTIEGYNPITRYRSGNAIHFEEGLSKYFDSGVRVGAISYQYVQVSGDSGSGATLGSFRARALAIGPSLGYTTLIAERVVSFTIQGTHDVASRNRLRQTSGLFMTTVKF